ncbi:MAG: sigma 54-interacting transcriptional regulator [Zoogloeaceae bacterium]|nr:sigma 54-interacting transcriptional regulator [Gammaproteobacteria bacterium]MCP5230854.1 sigma 54-interacting transcriptional regulator [Zoogloeaceae bacterium]
MAAVPIQALLATHDEPCLVLDQHLRIVAANKPFFASFQLREGDVLGESCGQLLNDLPGIELARTLGCRHDEILANGKPQTFICRLRGQRIPTTLVRVHCARVVDDAGNKLLLQTLRPLEGEMPGVSRSGMVGDSKAMMTLLDELAHAAAKDLPVLLQGESGTGKELSAEFIHNASKRRHQPFLTVDCTVLGADLFESELFGHEKGAFTGSTRTKRGLFELADGGTLFLDEIGEIPLSIQPKLLRALESGSFRRVGGTVQHQVDVRLVCATNRDLWSMVQARGFREDLYYRIAVFTIGLPPLRDRLDDIPALSRALLDRLISPDGNPIVVTPAALARLAEHDFPGNVRELFNVLQLGYALSLDGIIDAQHIRWQSLPGLVIPDPGHGGDDFGGMPPLPPPVGIAPTGDPTSGLSAREQSEATHIRQILNELDGNRRAAAARLGMSERTLYRKIKRYQLL